MSFSSASPPQDYIPTTSTPIVDENGIISEPWHRFFVGLWKKLGSGESTSAKAAYLVEQPDGTVVVYSAATNQALGIVQEVPSKGGAEQLLLVVSSPFTFKAAKLGYLAVENGKVELARSGPFYQISLVGGYFAMEPQDTIRVTWFGATPPQILFFPYS